MTIPEMISVLEAARDGKPIQWAYKNSEGKPHFDWRDGPWNGWDFTGIVYRVKPEPREWWVVVLEPNDIVFTTFKDKGMAFEAAAELRNPEMKVIHVREVIDEQP